MRSTPSRVPALALVGLSAAAVAATVAFAVAGAGGGEGAGGEGGAGRSEVRAGRSAGGRPPRGPQLHAHEAKWYNVVPSAPERERASGWGRRAAGREPTADQAALASHVVGAATATVPGAAANAFRTAGRMPAPASAPGPRHEFYFTRARYTGVGRGWRGRGAWSIDFPEADQHFVYGVRRLSYVDAYQLENPVRLDDPELRRYPFLYAVEVGHMALTDAEVEGLRSYLEAGGFLVVDDFWGPYEWENFEYNMRRVLPGRPIVEITLDHPLYSAFYEIDEIVQVPNVWNGRRGGPTAECWGCEPAVRGILDDDGRLLVLIHFNTDLGDAWEWADDPLYPIRYSTYAYQVGVNMIIYAMSH